jgi:hypothetical protein
MGSALRAGTRGANPAPSGADQQILGVDETYVRVKGRWFCLYRALDSAGATIDFLPSAVRSADAAKALLARALADPAHPQPRVINTDKAKCYPPAIDECKKEGALRKRCRHWPVQYLNNILEQDHRAIKKRIRAKQHFREFQLCVEDDSALRNHAQDWEGAGSVGDKGRHPTAERASIAPSASLPELASSVAVRADPRFLFDLCNTSNVLTCPASSLTLRERAILNCAQDIESAGLIMNDSKDDRK